MLKLFNSDQIEIQLCIVTLVFYRWNAASYDKWRVWLDLALAILSLKKNYLQKYRSIYD